MAIDYFETLNLDIIGTPPIENSNLDHWQKAARLSRLAYDQWKQSDDKRVQVDGVKYKLVPLFGETEGKTK